MARFEVMREERLDPDTQQFRPALLWVWDSERSDGRENTLLFATNGFGPAVAEYSQKADWAAARGHSPRAIWEYFGRENGNQYFVRRTSPIPVEYSDLDELVRQEMAILEGRTSLAKPEPRRAAESMEGLFEELLGELAAAEEMVIEERSGNIRASSAELRTRLEDYRRRFRDATGRSG